MMPQRPARLPPGAWTTCRAAAGAPLVAQGQIIGLLWVGSSPPLTDNDLRLLMAIADMAANAIHRASLYEETVAPRGTTGGAEIHRPRHHRQP